MLFGFKLAPILYGDPAIILRLIFLNDKRLALRHSAIIGNIACNGTTRANSDIVADFDVADNFRAGSDISVVADCRCAGIFAVEERITANRDALKDYTTLADLRRARYKNAVEIVRRDELIYISAYGNVGTEVAVDVSAFEQELAPFKLRFFLEIFFVAFPENFFELVIVQKFGSRLCRLNVLQRVYVFQNVLIKS